jgi:hypothetical protein
VAGEVGGVLVSGCDYFLKKFDELADLEKKEEKKKKKSINQSTNSGPTNSTTFNHSPKVPDISKPPKKQSTDNTHSRCHRSGLALAGLPSICGRARAERLGDCERR